jgi:acetyl esterase/lipase
MRRKIIRYYSSLAVLAWSFQTCAGQTESWIPLWTNGAPGCLGNTSNDVPALTPFFPPTNDATGAAIIICPGGGYAHLSPREGGDYALWLNRHGIACFVLQYRLGSTGYHYPAMFQDVTRALRLVRSMAGKWKIDPKRVGIMGSSAGGHLASMALTRFDAGSADAADPIERQSSRPDIGILCYPVITMEGPYVNQGSKDNLFGPSPAPELAQLLSSEKQVTPTTPPCFIWSTYEDKIVPMENSVEFATALRTNHVPFALHIYEKGRHGMALGDNPPFAHPLPWAADCLFWLREQGFVK